MSARALAVDDSRKANKSGLKEALKDWASWYMESSGYSDSTVLWRAVASQRADSPPTSCVPIGAIPPRGLERICLGMTVLDADPSHSLAVNIMQEVYKAANSVADQRAHDVVAQAFNKSPRTVYRLRAAGEGALRAWLRCN